MLDSESVEDRIFDETEFDQEGQMIHPLGTWCKNITSVGKVHDSDDGTCYPLPLSICTND
jgi:hypothetical protein